MVADYAGDIIWVLNPQTDQFSFISPSIEKMLGYTQQEVMEMSLSQLLGVKIESQVREELRKRLNMISPNSINVDELNMYHKEGYLIPIEVTSTPIFHDTNQFELVCVGRNITQRKEDEKKLIAQEIMLAKADEREKIGHDLHDGLGQILAYIAMQAQTTSAGLIHTSPEETNNRLQAILQAANEGVTQVRSVIIGLLMDVKSELVFSDFLTMLKTSANSLAVRYSIPIHLIVDPDIQPGMFTPGSEEILLRIINEAMINAIKHARASLVQINLQRLEKNILISIKDDGLGFDIESHSIKTSSQGKFGLSFMHERAEKLGGKLNIQSHPGTGTLISLSIPLFSVSSEDMEHLKSLHFLLTDDHPFFRDGLSNLLTAHGLKVTGTASDGAEALEKMRKNNADVVIMDLNMKPVGGVEGIRMIKAEFPTARILVLTVSEDEESLYNAFNAGADGYLLKNLDTLSLFTMLASMLAGHSPLAPEMADRVIHNFVYKARNMDGLLKTTGLTAQQVHILTLVSDGKTYSEIADEMHLSHATIKYHIKQIMQRLKVHDKTEAVQVLKQFRMQ